MGTAVIATRGLRQQHQQQQRQHTARRSPARRTHRLCLADGASSHTSNRHTALVLIVVNVGDQQLEWCVWRNAGRCDLAYSKLQEARRGESMQRNGEGARSVGRRSYSYRALCMLSLLLYR
jgi:hypothetical protein